VPDTVLKVFSYLPNPRVWKAQIAADIIGVEVETVGDKPVQLAEWLWDFNPRLLEASECSEDSPHARKSYRGFTSTLFKTDAFLLAHPFGTVPAAFSPDGSVGVFESNSILRAVARSGGDHDLYGNDGYEASRIDSFLDANLVFAREAQVYLLGMDDMTTQTHERMKSAFEFYLEGVERALSDSAYLVGDLLTIADISFACDLYQFLRERHYAETLSEKGLEVISNNSEERYPAAFNHLQSLRARPHFATYLDQG
jgi:elongation factor 1-gamma